MAKSPNDPGIRGELTDKQKKFCDEYLVDLNGTQAAIRAGYSEKTAQEQSSRLLSNVIAKNYIASKQSVIASRNNVTIDFVIDGIKSIATSGSQENNRLKAFEMLGKHLGFYEKDNKQKQDPNETKVIRVTYD